jgi:hypothetical protein
MPEKGFLEGKKTYIASAITLIIGALVAAGVLIPDANMDVERLIELVSGLIMAAVAIINWFQRAATKKVAEQLNELSAGQSLMNSRITPPRP